MAVGARRVTGADVAVAITGVTGGGIEGKPPGLTYVAVATPDGRMRVRRFDDDLGPGRNDERAARMALQIAARVLTSPEVASDKLPGTAEPVEPAGAGGRPERAGG